MDDDALVKRLREALDERVQRQDAQTQSRLNQARQRALEQLEHPSRRHLTGPLIGATAALALALVIWQRPESPVSAPVADGALEFELLLAEDSVDMIEEFEFYAVLDGLDGLDTSG